jgi:hypothetical protein
MSTVCSGWSTATVAEDPGSRTARSTAARTVISDAACSSLGAEDFMQVRALALLLNPGAWGLAPQLPGLLAAAGRALAFALLRARRRVPLNSAFARPARRGREGFRGTPGPMPLRGNGDAPVPIIRRQPSSRELPGSTADNAPERCRLCGREENVNGFTSRRRVPESSARAATEGNREAKIEKR